MNWLTKILLSLAAPGEKIPDGAAPPLDQALGSEGIGWGWAFFLFVALTLVTIWSYRRFASSLSSGWRVVLTALRAFLFALIVLLLVKPVLHLTVDESVRHPFVVLLDQSKSMGIEDRREAQLDLARAAIARGAIAATDAGKATFSPAQSDSVRRLSRAQILEALAANDRMNLWGRLAGRSNVEILGFGRDAKKLAEFNDGTSRTDRVNFFKRLKYAENVTALGDSLRQVLDARRGQPLAGILVVSDGANNTGLPPASAAAVAKQDGVPLFLYGVGITSPQYLMVGSVSGPATTNVKERVTFTARIKTHSMAGRRVEVQLKADGKVVDTQMLEIRTDGEQEIALGYKPAVTGEVEIEAGIPLPPAEAALVRGGNVAKTKVLVVNEKIKILLVQQEPNWDFRYLFSLVQRDRRLDIKYVLVKGDKGVAEADGAQSFLQEIPYGKSELYKYDVIVLADVAPESLGTPRMELLREWVDKNGGGIVLVAGEKHLPALYAGTPLAPLFPVEPQQTKFSSTYDAPVTLALTPAGEHSPLMTLSDLPEENRALWKKFPGVTWTAWVGAPRPGVQVLLADPTSGRSMAQGVGMPVITTQSYGRGQVLFIGTNQTYRWRHKTGEKYFARLWNQFFQVLSNQKMLGDALTRLKTERLRYTTGERVRINGHLFKNGFEPLTDAEVPGIVTVKTRDGKIQTAEGRMQSNPERPGEYSVELTAVVPGRYAFHTVRDTAVVLAFDVEESQVELVDIAMNEPLLREMAEASGGIFLREEDLANLPELVASRSLGNTTFKTIPLNFAPWLLGVLLLLAALEWFFRRKLELK
ncbi:MAG: VWA domain-containing protein [Puniceicoccales bacterium]|nr:VWA domain-containing protein [Puniceicoccales bacterium]